MDGVSLRIGGPKQRALLAILLLNANRVVSRDRLIDELAGGQADAPDHALRIQVSRLRKTLSSTGDGSRLVARPPGYLLRVAPGELDLHRFEDLVAKARQAIEDGDPKCASAKLRDAESLWLGRPLADLEFEPFARVEVERLEELRLVAIEERIEAELALGRHSAVVPELEALVAEHPLRERLRAQLMLALYRSGRQADALETYRAARALLVEELALDPSPRLKELEQAILRQDATLELARVATGAIAEATPGAEPVSGPEPPLREARRQRRRGPPVRMRWLVFALAAALTGGVIGVVFGVSWGGGGRPLVQGNAVVLVSARSGELRASTSFDPAPTRLAVGLGSLWVTHFDANTVSRIDVDTRAVRQTIKVGEGPFGIAVVGGDVWVANTLDGTVSRIDSDTNLVVQTIPVGSQPSAVAAADGAVWVASRGDGTVTRIDAANGRVTAVVSTGNGPSGIAATDGALWVTNQDDGTVARIDTHSDKLVQAIHVGDAPTAIAAAGESVWVIDRLDSTLSRLDPAHDNVAATIPVGGAPSDVAVVGSGVWVSDEATGNLFRFDTREGVLTRKVAVGERPETLGKAGGTLWVGVAAGGRSHRGGTLTLLTPPTSGIPSIDPAILGPLVTPLGLLGLTNDGLVTLDHVSGPDGARLVPDLALSLPVPSDDGRSYSFRLRTGIQYSTGATITPTDVRRSFERLFEMRSPGTVFYDEIVGAHDCYRRPRCDLSRGIVTNDRAGTVAFRLTAPDPDFLFKLAQPYAYVLPASTPSREARSPLPASGPYLIRSFARGRELKLIRNTRFREWSNAAQPDGYPDEIVWTLGLSPERSVTLMERGQADFLASFGAPPRGYRNVLRTRYPSQLHVGWVMGTDFFFLNTRAEPFNDVRVRRALNYAFDRNRAVQIYGGPEVARPTCQILPPEMPGFRRYCPYTHHPSRDGGWHSPDLKRARQLVAASGTQGMDVKVWDTREPQVALDEGRYLTSLLRRLGYRASLHLLDDRHFFQYTNDSRNQAQVVSGGWTADYPSPSTFIGKLSCGYFIPRSASSTDASELCDPNIDRQIARAQSLQLLHSAQANVLWARLDRQLTDSAVWLPTVTSKATTILSRRVGNYQNHLFWGTLIDQLWVR